MVLKTRNVTPQTGLPVEIKPKRVKKLTLGVAFAVAGIVLILLLVGLALTRRPWNDEAAFANPALNLAEQGFMGTTVLEHTRILPEIRRYSYYTFPLDILALAAWYKIVGFSLLATRVLSMIWTVVLLGEIYYLIRRWSGTVPVAVFAVLLVAFDYNMLVAGSFGRYEPMVAALGFGGYCAYLMLRDQSLGRALLASNALIAASGCTHPNGLMFFFGLVFLVLYHDRKRIGLRLIVLSAIPYLIGAVLWGQYLMRNPQAALAQLHANSSTERVSLLRPFAAVLGEIDRYRQAAGLGTHLAGHVGPIYLKSVPIVIYFAAIAVMLCQASLRRRPGYRVLLWLTAVHFAYLCFFEGMKFPFYLVHIFPLYASILAIVAHDLWTRRAAPRVLIAAAVAGVLAINIGGVLLKIRLDTYGKMYAPAVSYIQEHAGGSLVMASCDFGFAYGFRPNLIDDIRLGYFSGRIPKFIVVEETYQYNFDVWKTTTPRLYHYITNRLSEYDVVYNQNSYRIYRRKDALL